MSDLICQTLREIKKACHNFSSVLRHIAFHLLLFLKSGCLIITVERTLACHLEECLTQQILVWAAAGQLISGGVTNQAQASTYLSLASVYSPSGGTVV